MGLVRRCRVVFYLPSCYESKDFGVSLAEKVLLSHRRFFVRVVFHESGMYNNLRLSLVLNSTMFFADLREIGARIFLLDRL